MLRARHAPLLAAAAWLAGAGAIAWPFTVDDAFIVARYADRLARGLGYTYNDGAPTDGVTGPLWLAPLTLGARLGLCPVQVAKWTSACASFVALAWTIVRVRARAQGARSAWLVVAVACTSLSLVAWASAGLETGVATLAATAISLSVTRRPRPSGIGAGCAFVALVWLRPELLPFAAALLAVLAARERRAAWGALVLALTGVLLVIAFRLALFGHVLPMTVSAKPAVLAHGLAYVGAALVRPRALLLLVLLALAVRGGGRDARVLSLALAAHGAALVLAGGDWMPARRLFAPIMPTFALVVALGVSRLSLRHRGAAALLVSTLLATSLLALALELTAMRRAGELRALRAPHLATRVCSARGPVAAVDIGVLGFLCPNLTFLDLGGLTEPAVAYARGSHLAKKIDPAWLRARSPALIVLHSRVRPRVDTARRVRWFAGHPVERQVLAQALVRNAYEVQDVFEYTHSYFYVLLAPRRQERTETVKGRARYLEEAASRRNVRLAPRRDLAP